MKPGTLRGRLALVAALSTALWVLVMTVGIDYVVLHQLDRQAVDVLRTRAEAASTTVEVGSDGSLTVRESTDDQTLDTQIWVYQGANAVEEPPGRRALAPAAASLAGQGERLHDVGSVRLYARPIVGSGQQVGTIVAALDLGPYNASARLLVVGSIVLALVLAGSAYPVTRLVVGRALRPVADMSEQAARWSADDVEHRFGSGRRPRELERLSRDLDGLLDRLAAVLRHERRFSAEISHELRTPLTRIVAETELLQEGRPTELASGLAAIAASANQMGQILETLLATARSESNAPPGRCIVADAVDRSVEALGPPASARVEVVHADPGAVAGLDSAVLERVLAPLLQNAARHAAARIAVTSRSTPDVIEVDVIDDGPGLADLGERAFDPGVRGAGAHDGAGLGLALARRLARAAGGDIALLHTQQGASLRVTLPRG